MLFQGATVADALRAYFSTEGEKAPSPLPEARDGYGNHVALDGALTEGSKLVFNHTKEKKTSCGKK